MCLSMLPTMALAAENNSTDVPAEQTEQVVPESDAPDEEQAPDGEQASEEPTAPETDTAVAAVQKLINELPDEDGITAENAEEVSAQLDAIDEAKAGLTDEQSDKLDLTRYNVAVNAMLALSGANGANEPVVIAETSAHEHTNHDGSWIPIGGTDKNLGAIINKALTTGGLTDAKFYLTDNISYPEDFSQKLPIGSGKTVTLCLNGYTITVGKKEYHKEALFTVADGATLNICDCQGDGVIQGGLFQHKDPRFGEKTLDSLIEVEGGGTLNLYGGKLYGEYNMYDKMVDGEVVYMRPIVQLEKGSTFNMYGGTVEHWMHPDSASNRTPAYCPAVRGDGTFTVTGGTLIGAIANYVKIDGADENHPVYIDGNCFTISGDTIRNAVIKKASYLRELYNMENVTIEEADYDLGWNWTGAYTLTNCNLSGVRIRCTDKHTLTMTNSTVGTAEGFEKVNATDSTIQGVGDSSSGRIGISANEAILTESTVGGPITANNIELMNTNVTGTVKAPTTGKITVGGNTKVTDLYLKNGQKFYVDDLSNDAQINVRSDGAGDLIANPPGSSLEGKVTTSSGELSFSNDGQVTIVPSLDHEGKNYTALVQGSSEWTGTHQYYLTQDWTGDITIPSGANITLCLHKFDVTGNITVEEGGTLCLEVESTWYDPKNTIYGQIVNNGTLELRKVGWTAPSSGINYDDVNCINVNSGSKTAIVNTGTLTWRYHDKSYIETGETPSTVTNNGTEPTIVNSGTMDVQRITVINKGAGPVLSNTAGTARLAGTLTTEGNSEAVNVSGGEVKITRVTSGASGTGSAAIVADGGSVECVHERNSNVALSAPNAETLIRVEAGSTFKLDSSNFNFDPEFGTGKEYTLVNNGGTVSMRGNYNFVLNGVMLNKAGTMNLTDVKATGKGQVVVNGGELTVSGATAAEDLQKDIIMLNGGAVVLAGGTYKTNTGYYAVRVVNKDASLTAKGGVDMTNSAVYLCTDAKMAVQKEGSTAPRVKIVMETPGVFAENVTDSTLTSTVSSANANYAVKHNATAKTLYLELTGEHKHDSTTYTQLKDTDTALTTGYYYLPQSVKMDHNLTISGDVTICLNGSTLSFGKSGSGSNEYYNVKVQDGCTLTIQDELTGGGKLTNGSIQLAPTANFTLESGTLEAQEAVLITGSTESTNTNTVTIKGGAITALWAIRNVVSGATVNVTGGTLTMPRANTYGIDYKYQALIGMNGGALNISGGNWVQENQSYGMLVGPSSTTASNSTGTATVTGGSFTIGRSGFELYDGTANFSNVAFTTLSGTSNLGNAISCNGNAEVKLNKVTFDTIHGISVSDTANATLTDVTVKTYNRNTQLVSVGKTASATVESASIQPGTGTYNPAAINNAGTLNVKALTVADWYQFECEQQRRHGDV